MGGSSGGGDVVVKNVEPADYIETSHNNYLLSIVDTIDGLINSSPYTVTDFNLDNIILGIDSVIGNQDNLFTLFGSFLLNLDVQIIFNDNFKLLMNSPELTNIVNKFMADYDENELVPKLVSSQVNSRQLNAVGSSSFVINSALLESERIRKYTELLINVKVSLLQQVQIKSNTEINFDQNIVRDYSKNLQM
jgi:hypothetical protein